jgi:phage baseplate assembly protein V
MGAHLEFGYISNIDTTKGRVRVKLDADDDVDTENKLVSEWLPVLVRKSLQDKETFPFDVNEHVAVLFEDEHSEKGIVLGAIYDDTILPNGAGADIYRVFFANGDSVQYNRSTGKYDVNLTGDIDITGGAKVSVDAASEVKIQSATKVSIIGVTEIDLTSLDVKVSGNMEVVGTLSAAALVSAAGISVGGPGSGKGMDAAGNMTGIHDITATGNISTDGEVTAKASSHPELLSVHTHGGVTPGGGASGPPL